MSLKFGIRMKVCQVCRYHYSSVLQQNKKFRAVVLEDKHFHYFSVLYFKENPGEEEQMLSAVLFSLDTSPS